MRKCPWCNRSYLMPEGAVQNVCHACHVIISNLPLLLVTAKGRNHVEKQLRKAKQRLIDDSRTRVASTK